MLDQHIAETSVLIVEDEAITAMEIQSSLTRLGYRVSAIAASAEQAMHDAHQSIPDLVLMDINLKGDEDGIGTAEKFHSQMNVPVVYLTAYTDEPTLQRAKQAQPYGYIVKPFQEHELRITIETAIYKHQMDTNLREREQWYASLLTSLSEAVITTNMDERITSINPVAEFLTGWDHKMAQERPISEVFSLQKQEGIPDQTSLVSTAIRENHAQHVEGILKGPHYEGHEKWVTASASPIRTASGGMTGVALVFQDISQRKHAEEQLRQSEIQIRQMQKMEAVGTMAGGIAHDFNNILTSILGFTQLALSERSTTNPLQKHLQMILTGANRAKDLVQQILMFCRQHEKEYRPVELQSLVSESLKLLQAAFPSTIKFVQNLTKGTGMVMGDPTQLQQVVMNICTNAKHAMGNTCGTLEITLTAVDIESNSLRPHAHLTYGPYLLLQIRDSGGGINPKVLPRIFDPFFTTKPVGEGTGMGLAIAHGIINTHGGAITVTSEVGQGTTFAIFLPKVEWQMDSAISETHQKPPTGEGRILFIDDEDSLVQLGKEILVSLGYEVTCHTNSLKALEFFLANASQLDVIITDQTMPNLSGYQLVHQIRQIPSEIPIIMCTGFMTPQIRERMEPLRIQTLLTKPWTAYDLGHALANILKQET